MRNDGPRDKSDAPSPTAPLQPSVPRPRHKRRLANYMLDKSLQLRYIMVVTIMSAVIAGTLGLLINQQLHRASDEVNAALAREGEEYDDVRKVAAAEMAARDQTLILKMVGAGVGLAVLLSLYLVVMTHKVAGPLFKVSMYFDKMTVGKLGRVTALRKGDMLNDFYDGFKEMHEAVRARLQGDVAAMQKLVEACAAAGLDKTPGFGAEVEQLARHVEDRKAALS